MPENLIEQKANPNDRTESKGPRRRDQALGVNIKRSGGPVRGVRLPDFDRRIVGREDYGDAVDKARCGLVAAMARKLRASHVETVPQASEPTVETQKQSI